MSDVRQYIYSVVVAAILVSFLMTLIPKEGAIFGVLKLTAGLFLIMVVISPLVKSRFGNMRNYINNVQMDASTIITDAQNHTTDEIVDVIKRHSEAYVLDKASSLGADVTVEVVMGKEDSYLPEKIKIIGAVSPLVKKRLSEAIKEDLGIPEEAQTWTLA